MRARARTLRECQMSSASRSFRANVNPVPWFACVIVSVRFGETRSGVSSVVGARQEPPRRTTYLFWTRRASSAPEFR